MTHFCELKHKTTNTMEDNLTCSPVTVFSHEVVLAQQITVSITCVLSLIGAGLIIFSYVAFKDLRTGARQILVQLSIADIIVAASHMFGVLNNLPHYVHVCDSEPRGQEGRSDIDCDIQAGFTMFGVIATYLWTVAMAVYLLVIIVFEKRIVGKRLRIAFYPICWGIPLTVAIVFGSQNFLGFDESLDVGWCYLTWLNDSTITSQHRPLVPQLFGYALWSYLTFLLLPLLYIWIRCFIRVKLTRMHGRMPSPTRKSRLYDVKLTFIPLLFLLLRVPGLGLAIPHQYLSYDSRLHFRKTWWNAALVLCAGICSSAQGLVNAILFCAFTKVVRRKLILCLCCRLRQDKFTKVYPLQATPPASGGVLEDSTDSERGESPDNSPRKQLLAGSSDSVPKYHSINQGVSFTTE